MSKEEKVIRYYILCNKLKEVIRKIWISWKLDRERLESVAEHVYSVQNLALMMYIQYNYDIDMEKVAMMLAIHEIGETVIGDINPFEMSKEEKTRLEHEAVHNILKEFDSEDGYIEKLFLEFEEQKSKEAKFAFLCDKLECDLQAKLYGDEGCADLNHQEGNNIVNVPVIKELIDSGNTFGELCIKYSQGSYPYDENFLSVSNYALTHKLRKNNSK